MGILDLACSVRYSQILSSIPSQMPHAIKSVNRGFGQNSLESSLVGLLPVRDRFLEGQLIVIPDRPSPSFVDDDGVLISELTKLLVSLRQKNRFLKVGVKR